MIRRPILGRPGKDGDKPGASRQVQDDGHTMRNNQLVPTLMVNSPGNKLVIIRRSIKVDSTNSPFTKRFPEWVSHPHPPSPHKSPLGVPRRIQNAMEHEVDTGRSQARLAYKHWLFPRPRVHEPLVRFLHGCFNQSQRTLHLLLGYQKLPIL